MQEITQALIPIFTLIMIGYFFKKIKFPSAEFWPNADRLTYFVLMPALLIYKLANSDISSLNSVNFILTALFAIFFVFISLLIFNKFIKIKGDTFTSIVQGGIRFNTYVFLALADSLFGDNGIILAAILLAFVIPFINILCITSFALYASQDKLSFSYIIKSIITNPLILACFVGAFISYIDFNIPEVANKTLSIISSAALPLGLLSVGFGLVIKEIKSSKKELFLANFSKFLLMPLFMYIIALIFNLNHEMTFILMIFASMPTASSSYVLARQLGGDLILMSSTITVQTLASIVFILIILKLFI